MTLVEVLVAMVIAVGSVLALLTTLDRGGTTSLAQQRDTQAASIAEQEIERARGIVKQYGFDKLALSSAATAAAASGTNPTNPNSFVGGTVAAPTLAVRSSWHDTTSTLLGNEPLVVLAGAASGADRLAPGPETVTAGSTTATVWRYVTQRVNESCPASAPAPPAPAACAGDSKRVTVAVLVTAASNQANQRRTPTWSTTVINAGVPSNQANGSGGLELGVNLP